MQTVDTELRHAADKTVIQAMMDDLMVSFSRGQDYHYNYYFDTDDDSLLNRQITLRCRTIIDEASKRSFLTLKIPASDSQTYMELTQELTDTEMRELVYSNILPYGEIKDLTAIHGGHVLKKQTIRVSRVVAPYIDIDIFFDKITVRGIPHYEIGTKISAGPNQEVDHKKDLFIKFLKTFGETFTPAPRRSYTYRNH